MKPSHRLPEITSDTRPEIAIFRNNLFRISEPFITQQTGQFRRYRPFHLGRLRFGSAPPGVEALAVEDLSPRLRLPLAGLQILRRDAGSYLKLLRTRHPALVHAHFGIDGVYALPLTRRLQIPLVTTFHGFDATLSNLALMQSPAWVRYLLHRRELAAEGDLFLCASEFLRERVLALGFPVERIRVHYIGIDWRRIAPRNPADEAPVLLHVARLVEFKGAQYLIEAFAMIAKYWPEVRLVLIGDGPERTSLKTLARKLGLEDRINFLGARPHVEVMAWMRKATMLLLPSVPTSSGRSEGLGMVLLEAAATGVPVIGSRIGGIPEVVRDGETGLLVAPRDTHGLSRAIEQLLADAPLRRRFGAAARQRIEQHFDIDRQTDLLEGFYDQVIAARSGA